MLQGTAALVSILVSHSLTSAAVRLYFRHYRRMQTASLGVELQRRDGCSQRSSSDTLVRLDSHELVLIWDDLTGMSCGHAYLVAVVERV